MTHYTDISCLGGVFAKNTSRETKSEGNLVSSNCDKLSFVDIFSFEKLHHQFCKAVLGIKKTSCNISAKSELGRLPLDSFIKTQVMLYYSRIQSDGINPLVKEAFNINKNISNENIYTWYTFATEIFKEVELNKNNFEDFSKLFLLVKDSLKKL